MTNHSEMQPKIGEIGKMSDILSWPKPVKKKTIWLELEIEMWDEIEIIRENNQLAQEQVFNTLVKWGFAYYKNKKREMLTRPSILDHQDLKKEARERMSVSLASKHRDKKTPEEVKASKRAYAREYYKKHRGIPVLAIPPAPVDVEVKETIAVQSETPKPYVKTEHQIRMDENNKRRNEELQNKIVECALSTCEGKKKFIKGMGVAYHGLEFGEDKCLEEYINKFEKKTRSRLPEIDEDQPTADWDGNYPGEEVKSEV